jgi:hypothetical protein
MKIDPEPLLQKSAWKVAVAYLFINVYGLPAEDSEEWTEKFKIQPKIRETFHIPEGTDLHDIFRAIHRCKTEGITYVGQRNVNKTLGQPPIID